MAKNDYIRIFTRAKDVGYIYVKVPGDGQKPTAIDIVSTLTDINQKFIEKFETISKGEGHIGQGSIADAKQLEDFFSTIAYLSNRTKHNTNMLDKIADSTLMQEISTIMERSRALSGKQELFSSDLTWQELEDELAKIVFATIETGTGMELNYSEFEKFVNVGTASFRVGDQNALGSLANIGIKVSQDLVNGSTEMLSKEANKLQSKRAIRTKQYVHLTTSITNAKVDVSGKAMATFTISTEVSSELQKITRLLQQANISAKNYSSINYKKHIDDAIDRIKKQVDIHLGQSKLDSVLNATLQEYLSPEKIMAITVIAANLDNPNVNWDVGTKNQIREQIQKLRFIYELTGYGQHYVTDELEKALSADFNQNISLERVNYLIWFERASGKVTVRSTADLIMECKHYLEQKLSEEIMLPLKTVYGGT